MIEATIAQIAPLDQVAMEECQRRLDNLIKPLNSLGVFEKLACRIAGIFGVAKPQMPPCSLMLCNGRGEAT